MLSEIFGISAVFILLWIWFGRQTKLTEMPGPKGLPLLGVAHLMRPADKAHVRITEFNNQFGPVVHLPLLTGSTVSVSGVDAVYEVAIKKGYIFGARPNNYKHDIVTLKTGILHSREADDTWKLLRKVTQRHLKQFGDGMSRLESVIREVGNDMFLAFQKNCGLPYEPNQVIFDAALNSIAFLITGERMRTGDVIVEKMRHYEEKFMGVNNPMAKFSHVLIDFLPWIRFLGVEIWDMMMEFVRYEKEVWTDIKRINSENPEANSLCKILMDHVGLSPSDRTSRATPGGENMTETDARRTSMSLLLAGVTTTSNTFYASMNILAHHQTIQATMLEEIRGLCPEGQAVSLDLRPKMHYCRAFLLELLRYTSVVALSVGHRATIDSTIQGYFVPKDTRIHINVYAFHHDAEFWKDPEHFLPERFLNEDGEVVPADHPNRKHLMPFGAGPRVCVGETLAMTRLFLWITTLVNRFKVIPADDNDPSITLDTKKFSFVGVLRPIPYKVIITER